MRYALVNRTSATVENVIEIDALDQWAVPDGFEVEQSDTANIGDSFENGVFTAPVHNPDTA